MIGLLLVKHIHALPAEGVCVRPEHDPYFQHFTGEDLFQHALPHERPGATHWGKRIGEKPEAQLAESLRVAHATAAPTGRRRLT